MKFGIQFKARSGGDLAAMRCAPLFARRGLAVGLLCVAGIASPSASANDMPELSPSLTYAVSGTISPKCQLSTINPSVDIDNLANPSDNTVAAINVSLPFDVACNTPVRVAMASRNGGLKFRGPPAIDTDFTSLVEYRARVDLPGQKNVLSCSSESMADGRESCRRDTDGVVGSGKGAIQVQVAATQELLLAGRYSDQVTIVIAPLLGGED